MFKEHDCVVLIEDFPAERLVAGDVGAIVHVHKEGAAYEVEFTTFAGETVAIATVKPSQLRKLSKRDISHVREFAETA